MLKLLKTMEADMISTRWFQGKDNLNAVFDIRREVFTEENINITDFYV